MVTYDLFDWKLVLAQTTDYVLYRAKYTFVGPFLS